MIFRDIHVNLCVRVLVLILPPTATSTPITKYSGVLVLHTKGICSFLLERVDSTSTSTSTRKETMTAMLCFLLQGMDSE
jgi:hypothetical protein